MLSVTIFGWELSTTIVEGSTHIVDDNVYKMFGYTNNKSRVGHLKELCFSKAKTYPFILCESGEVLSSTENERKSSHRLQPGDGYIITPRMMSAMLLEKQGQGEMKLKSLFCSAQFAQDLCKTIEAPANITDNTALSELSVECANLSSSSSSSPNSSSSSSLPHLSSSSLPNTSSQSSNQLSPISSTCTSSVSTPKPPASRKRKCRDFDCECKNIFKVQRIVSDNTSARSKRRRVLASKNMFTTLAKKLPANVQLQKLEFKVKTTKAGDEYVHVVMDLSDSPPATLPSAVQTTPEATPVLPSITGRDAEIQVAVMDQKLVPKSQYHELAMSNTDMIRSYKVDASKKMMSSCIPVTNFDEGTAMEGCFRDVKDVLDYLFEIPEFFEPLINMDSPTLRLRFAGDDARTSRNKNTIVLLFNIIDEGMLQLSIADVTVIMCLHVLHSAVDISDTALLLYF